MAVPNAPTDLVVTATAVGEGVKSAEATAKPETKQNRKGI